MRDVYELSGDGDTPEHNAKYQAYSFMDRHKIEKILGLSLTQVT